jgi:ferritin-like metal-binding protein YciE
MTIHSRERRDRVIRRRQRAAAASSSSAAVTALTVRARGRGESRPRWVRAAKPPSTLQRIPKLMTRSSQKVVQYLEEAHASEAGLVRVLQSQIAMTPRGRYRTALERHLRETREHASRVEARLGELGHGDNPIQVGIGVAETVLAQGLAIAKTPLDLLRGSGGEEKVLKNAKDAAATEALEIATYTAIERLARDVDDDETARLAASIRADEERMLARILDEIPKLTDAVVRHEGYDVAKTGAADAARGTARKTTAKAKRTARRAPGAARAAGTARGAVAGEQDLPIARYGELTADEIAARLPELTQVELAQVEAYERWTERRSTVLGRIQTLRGAEPWGGYDSQTVDEIRTALDKADEATTGAAREYERAHKQRAGVLEAAERKLANA